MVMGTPGCSVFRDDEVVASAVLPEDVQVMKMIGAGTFAKVFL